MTLTAESLVRADLGSPLCPHHTGMDLDHVLPAHCSCCAALRVRAVFAEIQRHGKPAIGGPLRDMATLCRDLDALAHGEAQ